MLIALSISILLIFLLLYLIFYKQFDGFNNNYYKWNNCKTNNPEKLKRTFNNYGCIIIPNLLSIDDCNKLLKIIKKEERKKNTQTGNINSNYKRKDLLLPLDDTKEFIKKIYNNIKIFCDDLHPDGKIVENSCLISYPGSYPQIWHADTKYQFGKEGNLTSFGIALDDIDSSMGPLEVFLESNKIYKTDREELYKKNKIKEQNLTGDYDDGLKYQENEKICKILNFKKENCACKKGSLVIWSSKIIHRGGGNNKKKRPVFYFSLLGKGKLPYGATYSLKKREKLQIIKNI